MSVRRKLVAVDDPLETGPAPAPEPVAQPRGARTTAALYVRLPLSESDQLARAAFELGAHKRTIIAALIAAHVDARTAEGLDRLRAVVDDYTELSG